MHALLIAATVLFTAPSDVVPTPPAHFQMVIARAGTGFTAECATGCRWRTLAFDCGADCRVVIDESGVSMNTAPSLDGHEFAFEFQRTTDGWTLKSLRGTNWLTLSRGCGLLPCSARVDESGVSGS